MVSTLLPIIVIDFASRFQISRIGHANTIYKTHSHAPGSVICLSIVNTLFISLGGCFSFSVGFKVPRNVRAKSINKKHRQWKERERKREKRWQATLKIGYRLLEQYVWFHIIVWIPLQKVHMKNKCFTSRPTHTHTWETPFKIQTELNLMRTLCIQIHRQFRREQNEVRFGSVPKTNFNGVKMNRSNENAWWCYNLCVCRACAWLRFACKRYCDYVNVSISIELPMRRGL